MKLRLSPLLLAGLLLLSGCRSLPAPASSLPSPQSISLAPMPAPVLLAGGDRCLPSSTPQDSSQGSPLAGPVGLSVLHTDPAVPLALVFETTPAQTTLTLRRGEEALFMGTLEQFADYRPPANGLYQLEVWARWEDAATGPSGLYGYLVEVEYQLPMTLEVAKDSIPLGYCAVLRASYLPTGGAAVTASTDLGFTPTFYPYGDGMVALLPAKYSFATGEYHLTLTAGEISRDFTLNLTDGGFDVTVQNFEVDQSVADSTVNNQQANTDYEAVTRPLKNLGDPQKYWEGPFQLPIDQKYVAPSSTFGRIRIVNGVKDQHGGIDYPAPIGTQVTAPNNGRVLFAGYLQLTGNMICIEHGFGLKSWYYHLSAVDVQAGDMVKTGDPIGKVGDTGFVTGPHLHFTMSVNNIYVNPQQYLAADPLA